MAIDAKALRIEGIYQQNEAGQFMLRVKLASGVLSVLQAAELSRLGQAYGSGTLHLTTRGSVEFHDLDYQHLPVLQRAMAAVGLFSRGACGGAVRGIACSTGFGQGFNQSQVLGRKLLMYFSGNPHFEGLPKKFKIAVEADYHGSRHLIQDLGLVYVGGEPGQACYDVWIGGGLGRAPQAAILYRQQVPEAELLHLAEAVINVYRAHVEPPKRLKSLLSAVGEETFRQLLAAELAATPMVCFADSFDKALLPVTGQQSGLKVVVPVFAGELPAAQLGRLASVAESVGVDYLLVTADQDVALLPTAAPVRKQLLERLAQIGYSRLDQPYSALRICPGSHECRMGLFATRELAVQLQQRFGERLLGRTLAISGCANSCAQPQLAEIGIIGSKSVKDADGQRAPRFDLYRCSGEALGQRVAQDLTEEALLVALDGQF